MNRCATRRRGPEGGVLSCCRVSEREIRRLAESTGVRPPRARVQAKDAEISGEEGFLQIADEVAAPRRIFRAEEHHARPGTARQDRCQIPDARSSSTLDSTDARAGRTGESGQSVDMRFPDMLDSRIAAVQAMADLCGRAEAAKRSSTKREAIKREDLTRRGAVDRVEFAECDPFPMRCHKLQCLFRIGDGKLNLTDRTRIFCRLQKLWQHVEKHLERLSGREISCPHPPCKTPTVTLNSVEHLLNHAQREHNIRLRCR